MMPSLGLSRTKALELRPAILKLHEMVLARLSLPPRRSRASRTFLARMRRLCSPRWTSSQCRLRLRPINRASNTTSLESLLDPAERVWTTVCWLWVMEQTLARTTGKSRTHGACPGVIKGTFVWLVVPIFAALQRPPRILRPKLLSETIKPPLSLSWR